MTKSAEINNGIKLYELARTIKNELSDYLEEVKIEKKVLDILISPYNKILIPRTNLTLKSDIPPELAGDFFNKIKEVGFTPLNDIPRGGGYAGLYLDIVSNQAQSLEQLIKQALERGYQLAKILPFAKSTLITLYLAGENKELPVSNQHLLEQVKLFRQTDKYKGIPDLQSRLASEGYVIFTPTNFNELSDTEQTKLILEFRKLSIKTFADRFKKVNDFKKIVRDDVAQNLQTGDFNYNFRLATKDGIAVSAVFSDKDTHLDAYFCEYMLADQDNYTRPKGIATYLLDNLVKDIRHKKPQATIHSGFELEPNHDIKANSINTGCGAATAMNVGFEVLNQSFTEKQFKTANGIHPFAFNRMVCGNIIPTHAIWMELGLTH